MVAAIATLVFVLGTAGLMLHAGVLVMGGATIVGVLCWLPVIGVAAAAMALTGAESPLREKNDQ